MSVNNDKNVRKEKQDNPNWGGRVDQDIHEKLEKFYEESGIEKKGDFIKLLSDLASVHFAEEAMKDDFNGEYSKHYVELSKELSSYLLKVKHLFLLEVGGERVKWRELNQELLQQKEENQQMMADWNVVKQDHLKEVAYLEKGLREAKQETTNAKDLAKVLEEKNNLLQQEKEHLQNVINDKDKVNVNLLGQLNELEEFKKEHEEMAKQIAEQSMLLKEKDQELVQLEKQRKLDVKEAITDTERRVQNEMFGTISKQQEEIKGLYATVESVRAKKDAEIEKVRNERDMKVNELQKEMKESVESMRSEKDAEIARIQKDAELRIKPLQKEIDNLNGTIEVLRAGKK
ncbi:hypothetical protein EXW34_31325 (plasmid) [Bacillus mycoides]|uniref:hypothetical protein n=1 Tax=Bacillus mycoides TaxID=1405 RepID=UPI001C011F38|nr:hypothetical protein [Bacillus mycoides]QWI25664.1 hypothetical protein EXW34_31325 [Bacillus mycoides]